MKLSDIKPGPELMYELEQVSAEAGELRAALAGSNFPLPEDFPEGPLDMVLGRLVLLPQGTADGCVGPLQVARSRLPKIRRAHILSEAQAATKGRPDHPLIRDGRIDERFKSLAYAISTALDAYHAQMGTEDEPADEAGVELDAAHKQSAGDAALASERLGLQLDADAVEAEANAAAVQTEAAEAYARAERGFSGMAISAAAESRMPRPQPKLLTRLGAGIVVAGQIVEQTGRLVRPTIDVALRFERWIDRTKDEIVDVIAERGREAGDMVAQVGRDIQAYGDDMRQRGRPPTEPPPTEVDDETRKAAEARVRESLLAGRAPDPADAAIARELDLSGARPTRGEDLELRDVPRPDLLRSLTGLRELDISRTTITDLTPLAGLAGLQRLDLDNTKATDLAPLAGLASLQTLERRA